MDSADARRRPELDGLRALAVLSVVVAHAAQTATGPLAVFLGHIGSRGVDLFFVLSGCCLSYPLLVARSCGDRSLPSPVAFLRRRLSRIAPPYYVAIALFGLLAFTPFGLPTTRFAIPSTPALLGQLAMDAAFLTNMHPAHNEDFWTLGFEMRWYVVFPIALALYVRSRWAFGAAMVVSALVYAWFRIPDCALFPCFMSGIVAADIAIREPAWRRAVWPASALFLGIEMWMEWQRPSIVDHADPFWQFAVFLIVVGVLGSRRLSAIASFRAFEVVGIASYSIYLVHHPIIDALAHAGVPLWIAVPIALAAGFAFWRFAETPLVRREVRRKIERALRLSFLFPKGRRVPEEATVRGTF
jgi:peptidoglycan/LPS O-acetylase OafA/YrhL